MALVHLGFLSSQTSMALGHPLSGNPSSQKTASMVPLSGEQQLGSWPGNSLVWDESWSRPEVYSFWLWLGCIAKPSSEGLNMDEAGLSP